MLKVYDVVAVELTLEVSLEKIVATAERRPCRDGRKRYALSDVKPFIKTNIIRTTHMDGFGMLI